MPVLKIIENQIFKLSDNHAKRSDPYRFTRLKIIDNKISKTNGPQSITLSGTIKDQENNGLPNRSIRVFDDEGMIRLLGQTYSSSDGSWSMSVPGGMGSRFVAIAQSESGENAQIFVKINQV